jgi:hypothetical protein
MEVVLIPPDVEELTPGHVHSLGIRKKRHSGQENRACLSSCQGYLKSKLGYDSVRRPGSVVLGLISEIDCQWWL